MRRQAATSREAAEIAAGSMKIIPRSEVVTRLAARFKERDAYMVAAGPGEVPSAAARPAPLGEATAYLDRGDDTVMTVTGTALKVMPDVTEAAPGQAAAVWVIPKTVATARLGSALGGDIPADGSRDLIMITTHDGGHTAYPMILVDAIGQVDPQAAADIRRGERDVVLSHMSPGIRALVDQADAAAGHAASVLAAMAAIGGGTHEYRPPSLLVREMTERFALRAACGELGLCPHLSPAAPQPAFWSAWDPGSIRCGRCIGPEADAIKGTDEEHRCDHCRQVNERIHNEAVLLPPVVADLPGLVAASGPLTLMFGLCPEKAPTAARAELTTSALAPQRRLAVPALRDSACWRRLALRRQHAPHLLMATSAV